MVSAINTGHSKLNSWKGEFIMTNTKKKKGNKMKLLSAVGMLTVSAAMLVSSTFAWFSMNKSVKAQTMSLTAKSDGTYLLINNGSNDTAAKIQAGKLSTLTWTSADYELYPSAPITTDDEVAYAATGTKDTAGDSVTTAGAKVTSKATAALNTNWYTAYANDPSKPDIDDTTARQLAGFNNYVVKETLYLTVAAGANNAKDLKVTPTFTQSGAGNDIAAYRMLVATSDGGFAILKNGDSLVDISGSNTELTDSTVLTVDVYFYIDGNAAPVYTNNKTNLTGAEMKLEFFVEPVVPTT